MKIHQEPLAEIDRYIRDNQRLSLEDTEAQFRNYLKNFEKIQPLTPGMRVLEIGTGTGWFPITCKLHGISCKGLEISPQLVEYAREFGRRYGVEADIELGNIEDDDIGAALYDVIIASSVFEHVEHWQRAIQRIYRALRPGGVFFFSSTNKFAPLSGEYFLPFYGWLPDALRYRLRILLQGPDVMKLGIDFHQFRYGQLRREFKGCGFPEIYDRVDLANPAELGGLKAAVARLCKRAPLFKHLYLTFTDATVFVCRK